MNPSARPLRTMVLAARRISSSFFPVMTVLMYCFSLHSRLMPRMASR